VQEGEMYLLEVRRRRRGCTASELQECFFFFVFFVFFFKFNYVVTCQLLIGLYVNPLSELTIN
jgi:hypothetical protein